MTIQEGDRAELRTAPTTTSKKGEGKEEKSNQAVPNKDTTVQPRKKIPRPIDFDDFWYQDEGGNWRNEYDDQGFVFDDEASFYTEEELSKEEAKLKAKVLPKNVNEISKKEIAAPATNSKKPKKKVQKKPEDYEDMWYQDYDGNWFNEYDQDDIEWEDGDGDSAPATLS